MAKKGNLILPIMWLCIGILIVAESYKFSIGSLLNPGSGLFPFLLGITLVFTAGVSLFTNLRTKREGEEEVRNWAGLNFSILCIVVLIQLVYAFVIEKIGFSLTTFCCLFFLFYFGGSIKVVKALFLSIIVTLFAYILFVIILEVSLPSFPWYIFV